VTSVNHEAPRPAGLLSDRSRLLAGIAFLLGLATILGALGSEIFGGLVACELCHEQRRAYYWGLPVLALVLVLWNVLPRKVWLIGLGIAALIFAWSITMAGYHAGVEYGFWPGPTACTGIGVEVSFSDLSNVDASRVVPCDKVQFRFLGITLAGYNFLISVAITALLVWSLITGRRSAAR
jgi:disulfide bond formation protein DsbB